MIIAKGDPALRLTAVTAQVFALLSLTAFTTACTLPEGQRCGADTRPSIQDTLYFGTQRPGAQVSRDEWTEFLRSAVTPRFPDGLTVWPASGQWRDADGRSIAEDSFVLSVVHPSEAGADAAVAAIIGEYKKRFDQQAVLRVRQPVCSSL